MKKTAPINKRRPLPSLRFDPKGALRCHNYMPDATCAWAVERGMCAEKRWNVTHCPVTCGNGVCGRVGR